MKLGLLRLKGGQENGVFCRVVEQFVGSKHQTGGAQKGSWTSRDPEAESSIHDFRK